MTSATSDFRSDTVTRPSARMRRAMAEAEVGDDVLDGDPTVGLLERRAAEWLGKEGALFVPSGTMANQVAMGVWSARGDEVIAEETSHILLYEAGALGRLHGLQAATIRAEGGLPDPDAVARRIRPDFVHCPRTACLVLEQTQQGRGGRVLPYQGMRAVSELARERGVAVHLDGARLANAVVASGVEASAWSALADSVSICLSKGLGAPVGSLVAGDAAFLVEARVHRKRLGGWMRQSGILAAAGLVALEENVGRLEEDHRLARDLAERLDAIPGLSSPPETVETNIALVRVERAGTDAPRLAAQLADHDVLVLALDPGVLRFVTHLDVGPEDVERLERTLRHVLSA